MVRRLVLGAYRYPVRTFLMIALLVIGGVFLVAHRSAYATAYANPFWAQNTTAPDCLGAGGCGGAPVWSPEGVNYHSGELAVDFPLFIDMSHAGTKPISLRWRSMVSGSTQMGTGMLPSWETTAKKVIVNQGNPNSAYGHYVDVRLPSGAIPRYDWLGSAYSAATCGDHNVLTTSSGNYVLTNKWGDVTNFDSRGMPASYVDRNGNTETLSYDSSYRLTSYTPDIGNAWTITTNGNDFITQLADPWVFTYDSNNNLTSITTPTTPDQSIGSTTTLGYDGSSRLTSVTDGRGNATTYTYVSSSRQISTVTRNGHTVSFAYYTGRTERTDGNGNVHRIYFTGSLTTSADMYVSSSKYLTTYSYSGSDLVTVVYPRGNRVDYTYDGNSNRTEKRRKIANTSGTNATDIVESWAYTSNFVTSYTNPLGNVTTYTRDGAGNLTQIGYPNVSLPTSQTSVTKSFTYNGRGQITQETDEEGKVKTYSYYASGFRTGMLSKIEVDPSGLDLTTLYNYDSALNVTTVTDPRNHATTTTWDALRRRTSVAPPISGYETDYHYDENNNLVEVDVKNLDKDGYAGTNAWVTTTYTYTAADKVATIVEETDSTHTRTTSLTYDANENPTSVTKPEGNVDTWTYDERDLVSSHTAGYGATEAATNSMAYDDNGNLLTETDARSNDTTHDYDLFDRRTKTTNALGNYEETDYDKAGNVTEVRRYDAAPSPDMLLQRETYSFDARNRRYLVSALRKDPSTTFSDATTTTERFKTGTVKKVTNPRGKDTTYTYDAAWRLTKTTDAMGNEFSNSYDANGNRTAWSILEMDGGSSVTHVYQADFDNMNRRIEYREIDRTSGVNVLTTTYAHDSRGNMTFVVNAAGNPTRYTFDDLSRMTKKEIALTLGGNINTFSTSMDTQWRFDKNNRLVSFKDDAANESTWTYDALDRQSMMVYPNTSQVVAYGYDGNGNTTQTTDPAGNVINDTFDAANRRTARAVTLVAGFVDTTSEAQSFDALGRLTNTEDDDYKVEYTYGVVGLSSQVYEEKQSYAVGTAYTKTVTKTYDAAGNKATETYPAGLSLAYSYNDVDAYASISDGTNTIASFSYIGLRQKIMTYQSGATAATSYTGFRGEVATIKHETSTPTTLLELDYGYDSNHDRTYERYGSSGSPGDAFAYDKARRITIAWLGSSTPSNPTGGGVTYVKKIDYNMDDDGNRTSVVTTPYGQTATSVSYSAGTLHQYTAVGGTSPTYDANGNQTDNGIYKFKYNYKNLICEVRLSANDSLVATYYYDPLGRRIQKVISGGVTQRYVYSRMAMVEVYDGAGGWKQSYVVGRRDGEVLMLEQQDLLDFDGDSDVVESTRSFFHVGPSGSVMLVTDLNQGSIESMRYTPYGECTISVGGLVQATDALGQLFAYVGGIRDDETGMYLFSRRYYDPTAGRFLQRDPLGYGAGRNLYEYCYSNPLSYRDLRGLSPEDCCEEERRAMNKAAAAKAAADADVTQAEERCNAAEAIAEAAFRALRRGQGTQEAWDSTLAAEDAATQDLFTAIRTASDADAAFQAARKKFLDCMWENDCDRFRTRICLGLLGGDDPDSQFAPPNWTPPGGWPPTLPYSGPVRDGDGPRRRGYPEPEPRPTPGGPLPGEPDPLEPPPTVWPWPNNGPVAEAR